MIGESNQNVKNKNKSKKVELKKELKTILKDSKDDYKRSDLMRIISMIKEIDNDKQMNNSPINRLRSAATSNSDTRLQATSYRSQNHLKCWGSDEFSQTQVPLLLKTDTVAVKAGEVHNCAVNSKGELICWGLLEHNLTTTPMKFRQSTLTFSVG
mmetsp:Transcript_65974/g.56022  ORF Transcript_65974/g.56022 Transcript_65974/m.56022 type:complete len:155 (+) Transcript_65974:959-1423(+)